MLELKERNPITYPVIIVQYGLINPDPGVMHANPAKAPLIRFVNLNFFSLWYPNITHINADDEALICVFNTAIAAYSLH